MKLEEAMVYVLASAGCGLTTEQIADNINRKKLHVRKDGLPVTGRQIYTVVCRNSSMFIKEGGHIMLMI